MGMLGKSWRKNLTQRTHIILYNHNGHHRIRKQMVDLSESLPSFLLCRPLHTRTILTCSSIPISRIKRIKIEMKGQCYRHPGLKWASGLVPACFNKRPLNAPLLYLNTPIFCNIHCLLVYL